MSWQSIDSKHKKKYGRNFVACEEGDEREYVINLIKEILPYYARVDIARAVQSCCQSIDAPRQRDFFLQCVRQKLEEEA
jgi:hypothetical protein